MPTLIAPQIPLETQAEEVANQLNYYPDQLSAALEHQRLALMQSKKGGGAIYRSTENPDVLVRYFPSTSDYAPLPLPTDPEALADHVRWHEDELVKLGQQPNLGVVPHYTVVGTLENAPYPALFTVTQNKGQLTPVVGGRDLNLFNQGPYVKLKSRIAGYLLEGNPLHKKVISDITSHVQWHREGEDFVLHDLDPYTDYALAELAVLERSLRRVLAISGGALALKMRVRKVLG